MLDNLAHFIPAVDCSMRLLDDYHLEAFKEALVKNYDRLVEAEFWQYGRLAKTAQEYSEQVAQSLHAGNKMNDARNYLIMCGGQVVGCCRCWEFKVEDDKTVEIGGLWLDQAHEGKGIMSRCVKVLALEIFQKTAVETLVAFTCKNNLRAQKTLDRCFFRSVATTGEQYRYERHRDSVSG